MAESKRTKGFLPSSSALDNPSILSKLMNNDAMERPTGATNESLNNFMRMTLEFFAIYLMSL